MFVGELLDYQDEAASACVLRGKMLIAFEPGMGKTPTTIAVVEDLGERHGPMRTLVLAGSALRFQWRDEIAKFTGGEQDEKGRWSGGQSCVVVDGTPEQRWRAYRRIREENPAYVIMGYENVVNDWRYVHELVSTTGMDVLVMDEVSALKSPGAMRTQATEELSKLFRYRFGLSGTPMENGKPDELFSIMTCIDPTVLGDPTIFDKTFVTRHSRGYVIGYRNLPLFHTTISAAMTRRLKTESDRGPERVKPLTHLVRPDGATAELADIIIDDLCQHLVALPKLNNVDVMSVYTGTDQNGGIHGDVAARITVLRMLYSDPAVLRASALRWGASEGKTGSKFAAQLAEGGFLEDLPRLGPKVRAAVERIDDLLEAEDANKVVVFAFFKTTLGILHSMYPGESVLFTGSMNASQKAEARRKFQHDPKIRLFLSSDAGGFGIDLPQANWLLNLDLPFSKGKADQRNSRHDRVSSMHERIHTETFLISGSIEQFYARKLEVKGSVARAILDGRGYDRKRGELKLDLGSLLDFLGGNDH